MKKMRFFVVALVFMAVAMLAGCAYYPVKQDWKDFSGLSPKSKVFTLKVAPAEGVKISVERLNRFREIIAEELTNRDLQVVQRAAYQNIPLVKVEITKYDEGDFAVRFLLSSGLGGAVIIETAISVINEGAVVMKGTLNAETSSNPFNFSSAYGTVEGVQRKIAKQLAERISTLKMAAR